MRSFSGQLSSFFRRVRSVSGRVYSFPGRFCSYSGRVCSCSRQACSFPIRVCSLLKQEQHRMSLTWHLRGTCARESAQASPRASPFLSSFSLSLFPFPVPPSPSMCPREASHHSLSLRLPTPRAYCGANLCSSPHHRMSTANHSPQTHLPIPDQAPSGTQLIIWT